MPSQQALAVSGAVVSGLALYGEDSERITTLFFTFWVKPDPLSEDIISSTTEFDALGRVIAILDWAIRQYENFPHLYVLGRFETEQELLEAFPDGSMVGGGFFVGSGTEAKYYYWSIRTQSWESADPWKGPRGEPGKQGPPGENAIVDFNFKGAWDADTVYTYKDLVFCPNGRAYVSIMDNNVGIYPPNYVNAWVLWAVSGTDGGIASQTETVTHIEGVPYDKYLQLQEQAKTDPEFKKVFDTTQYNIPDTAIYLGNEKIADTTPSTDDLLNITNIETEVLHFDTPAQLCDFVDNELPKFLTKWYEITVGEGTTERELQLVGLSGGSRIAITGATTRDQLTHRFGRIFVSRCNNAETIISGLTSDFEGTEAVTVQNSSAHVRFENCNVVVPGARGFHALRSPNAEFINCMCSNRNPAFTASRCQLVVEAASGENNTTLYHTVSTGEIRVLSEGTIHRTGSYATTSWSSGGGTYNARGEKVPQSNSSTAETLSSVTHTVDAADARAFIDNLPQELLGSVTVLVRPGTIPTDIRVRNRRGPGSLFIQAVDAAGVSVDRSEAHQTPRIFVERNTNPRIVIRGFTVTTTDTTAILAQHNSCYLELRGLSATGGLPVNTNNIGVDIPGNMGGVWVRSCLFSNKNIAVRVGGDIPSVARISGGSTDTLAGRNNTTFASAVSGGSLYVSSTIHRLGNAMLTTDPFSLLYVASGSGVIFDSDSNQFRGLPSNSATEETVTPAQLRPLIRRLNSMGNMNRNLTINVTPGSTADVIDIARWRGSGEVTIRAVDGAGNPITGNNLSTHMINRLTITDCSNTRITVTGFRLTSASNQSKILVVDTKCPVEIISVNNIGAPTTIPGTSTIFLDAGRSPNVFLGTYTSDRQHIAVRVVNGAKVITNSGTGIGNMHAYSATTGGKLNERNATRPGHVTAIALEATGGRVDLWSSGRLPPNDASVDLGTTALRWRDVHVSRNVIANGVTLTSDKRAKRDIGEVAGDIKQLVTKLKPVAFSFEDEGKTAPKHIGFLAQDIEKAMDECGILNADTNLLSYTPITEIIDGEEQAIGTRLGINLMELVTALIITVQDSEQRIRQLEELPGKQNISPV